MPESVEFWSKGTEVLKVIGFCIAGLALLVTVLGWHFSSRAGMLKDAAAKIKEVALERFKQESAMAIAEADAKAAEANKIAAQANATLANTQLELEKLRYRYEPRGFGPLRQVEIRNRLYDSFSGRVTIEIYQGANNETKNFANQCFEIVKQANIPVAFQESAINDVFLQNKWEGFTLPRGVVLRTHPESSSLAKHFAFMFQDPEFESDNGYPLNVLVIRIGEKPDNP